MQRTFNFSVHYRTVRLSTNVLGHEIDALVTVKYIIYPPEPDVEKYPYIDIEDIYSPSGRSLDRISRWLTSRDRQQIYDQL